MRRGLLCLLVLVSACAPARPKAEAIVVVDVPVAASAALATQIQRGAQLAIDEINANGGVAGARLAMKVLDSGASPERTAENMRTAAALGAVAVVDEGTGVDAGWRIAADAGIPIGIVYQGAPGLVDVAARRNVYRIAPTDHGIAFRYAEYLVPKGLKVGIVTDDSTYGNGGRAALAESFAHNPSSVAARIQIPSSATDLAPEILRARRSGATALLVWARPQAIALAIRDARQTGWNVPIFTPPSGEDPFVRQQLADRPDWVDGMTVALSRLTSEKGPVPYDTFRTALERKFGEELVGVKSNGKDVVQAPDVPMYAYDFVHVVAAAIARTGRAAPSEALVRNLEQVEVRGANGDERAFNELNHEGVVDDDVFFARFHGMTWAPVRDDALSATLVEVRQTR